MQALYFLKSLNAEKTQEKGLPPASGPLSSSPCDRAGLARFASLAILCNFFAGFFEGLATVHIVWVCIEHACYIGDAVYILYTKRFSFAGCGYRANKRSRHFTARVASI